MLESQFSIYLNLKTTNFTSAFLRDIWKFFFCQLEDFHLQNICKQNNNLLYMFYLQIAAEMYLSDFAILLQPH